MDYLDLTNKNPDAYVDDDFIESALDDMDGFIAFIEKSYNRKLLGDRKDFDRARMDWIGKTRMQVVRYISEWKAGILKRYNTLL